MKTVLVADRLPDRCSDILQQAGLEVRYCPGLSEDELKEAIEEAEGVICRSGATLSESVIESARRLEAICRAGVGVNNIDVAAASRRGVVVMNTPGANTLSTAEHAFALMLALARNIGPAYIAMREARWAKKQFLGSQLAGSTLGIVGLGRIGQAVARRGFAFEMNVLAHDPYLSSDTARRLGVELLEDLDGLLKRCDYLTVHVPENEQTQGLIGAEQIAAMRPEARVINCARGSVVDQDAVVRAVREGRLAGAAFDVYVKEPPESYEFAQNDRILATPHLGASTEEAQIAVATEAADQMVDALLHQHYRNALNVTPVPLEEMKVLQPYCDLAARLGKLVAQLNRARPKSVEVSCRGDVAERSIQPIVNYGLMGVLRHMVGRSANIVSAPHLAEERGITVTSTSTVGREAGFTDLIEIKLVTDRDEMPVAGTVFGHSLPRVVSIGEFYVEVIPEGELLVVRGRDVPGLIGRVGAILGEAGVNVARMGFGRREKGGDALLALNLDSPAHEAALQEIRGLEVVENVAAASF